MRDMPPGARRLLSAGCSGAWYFDWVEKTYGHVLEHVGVEYYSPKPDNLPENVSWISNTVGNMSGVPSATCDLAISGQNIEHLWPGDTVGFLLEAARVLRPGGTLCIDSPNRAITSRVFWSHPEHTVEYTVPEIRNLLELAGFSVTKTAGIWLCQDPKTNRVLAYDPNVADQDWSVTERMVSGRDKPESSLLWWLEGRRLDKAPDEDAIRRAIDDIFAKAWPERTQRLVVPSQWKIDDRTDGAWVRVPTGSDGIVFFGPYMPLRAGTHRVIFDIEMTPEAQAPVARFEVTSGMDAKIVASREALPGEKKIEIDFEIPELVFGGQFRCISFGRSAFSVHRHVDFQEDLRDGT